MSNPVVTRTYEPPAIDMREALRYAGVRDDDPGMTALMNECIEEAKAALSYKVCFTTVDIRTGEGETVEFPFGSFKSSRLSDNLAACDQAVLFAATIGIDFDRLVSKYSRISPAKAVMLQAFGSERIESLCNVFNEQIKDEESQKGRFTRPRFSPGYGDLSLDHQRILFRVLDCSRKIGLTLNDSMIMSPAKSVTAIIGTSDTCSERDMKEGNCSNCNKKDCVYRK